MAFPHNSDGAFAIADGTQFKALLASDHDIQINKTSRHSVLGQININNTRSDLAHLIKALADMARAIDKRLADGGEAEQAAFKGRVKSLVEDVPDLPDFQRFHDAFRDDPKSAILLTGYQVDGQQRQEAARDGYHGLQGGHRAGAVRGAQV